MSFPLGPLFLSFPSLWLVVRFGRLSLCLSVTLSSLSFFLPLRKNAAARPRLSPVVLPQHGHHHHQQPSPALSDQCCSPLRSPRWMSSSRRPVRHFHILPTRTRGSPWWWSVCYYQSCYILLVYYPWNEASEDAGNVCRQGIAEGRDARSMEEGWKLVQGGREENNWRPSIGKPTLMGKIELSWGGRPPFFPSFLPRYVAEDTCTHRWVVPSVVRRVRGTHTHLGRVRSLDIYSTHTHAGRRA